MRVLLRLFIGIFTITLFVIFGGYYLCSIYFNSYQINNNIKIFYDMKKEYEISVANKNWPVSNYILEKMKKNPNSIEEYRLNIIDFYYIVISGLFKEKLLVDENQREQELILLEREIPLENRS